MRILVAITGASGSLYAQRLLDNTPPQVLRSPIFWVMYLVFVMVAAGGLMTAAQIAPIAKDFKIANEPVGILGFQMAALTFAISLDRIFDGFGRPFFGWVSDQIGREHTMFIAFSTAALMVLILTAAVVVRVRRRRDAAPVAAPVHAAAVIEPASGSESLALAAERGLAEVGDLSREPREAIIACYAAMENALENAPGAAPQDSDTPSEVLARAVEHHALQSGSAGELVTLFAEARFSTHVMNEGHREAAERARRLVLDELRSPV